MLSKFSLELPYYSEKPLNQNTEWVAFPVFIESKGKDYNSTLAAAKEIVSKLESLISSLANENCKYTFAPPEDSKGELNTVFEFRKTNNECETHIYHYSFINFQGIQSLWDKMGFITQTLDEVSKFSEDYKSDKKRQVQLGISFRGK